MHISFAERGEPVRRRQPRFCKAVNCEHPVDGSPCGTCEACRAIAAGNSMNVIEIDAASNNGVENIRQIREEVEYAPTEGNIKCILSTKCICYR